MSFTFKGFNPAELGGVKCILSQSPSLSVNPITTSTSKMAGSVYSGSTINSTIWTFNVTIYGNGAKDALTKAETISANLYPDNSLHEFTPEPWKGWVWKGALTGEVVWTRDEQLWKGSTEEPGLCVLHGLVSIMTPDPHGYKDAVNVSENDWGEVSVTLTKGTLSAYPQVVISGSLTASQKVVIGECEIATTLEPSMEMVLDFHNMDFYLRNSSGERVANIADKFIRFSRLTLPLGNTVIPIEAPNGGELNSVTITAKARRI